MQGKFRCFRNIVKNANASVTTTTTTTKIDTHVCLQPLKSQIAKIYVNEVHI